MKISTPNSEYIVKFHYGQSHKGRETVAIVTDKNNRELSASTICAEKDNFSKFKGRKIALSRALSSLSREERKHLWMGYLEKVKIKK